jgi:hypothetical protein
LAFAGIVVDVSSGAIVDSCRSSICVAIAPAAFCSGCRQQLVTPLIMQLWRSISFVALAAYRVLAIVIHAKSCLNHDDFGSCDAFVLLP